MTVRPKTDSSGTCGCVESNQASSTSSAAQRSTFPVQSSIVAAAPSSVVPHAPTSRIDATAARDHLPLAARQSSLVVEAPSSLVRIYESFDGSVLGFPSSLVRGSTRPSSKPLGPVAAFGRLTARPSIPGVRPPRVLRSNILCTSDRIFNEPDDARLFSHGKIYVPKNPDAVRGLVLATNGQGPGGVLNDQLYKTAFDYLLRCLAANGFVAVAVKSSTSTAKRVSQVKESVIPVLNAAAERGVPTPMLSNLPIGLIGHSEACASMAQVAYDIKSGQGAAFGIPYANISAVVALGPTYDLPFMHTDFADSVFVVSSTHDEQPGVHSAYRYFDFAGESSFACSMLLWGVSHFRYLDAVNYPNLKPGTILDPQPPSRDLRHDAINFFIGQVVTMFLTWRMAGDGWEAIFRDGWQPGMSSGDPNIDDDLHEKLQIFWQYRDEGKQVGAACSSPWCVQFVDLQDANGSYSAIQMPQELSKLWPDGCFSRRHGYRVRWVENGGDRTPSIWIIPSAEIKAKPLKYLEFDLAQTVYGSAPTEADVLFEVSLTIAGPNEKTVYAPGLFAVRRCIDVYKTGVGSAGRSLLHTYKIRFAEFGITADDVSKIKYIVINFAVPGGAVAADLLLSEFQLAY